MSLVKNVLLLFWLEVRVKIPQHLSSCHRKLQWPAGRLEGRLQVLLLTHCWTSSLQPETGSLVPYLSPYYYYLFCIYLPKWNRACLIMESRSLSESYGWTAWAPGAPLHGCSEEWALSVTKCKFYSCSLTSDEKQKTCSAKVRIWF